MTLKRADQLQRGDVVMLREAGEYPVDLLSVETGLCKTVLRYGPGDNDYVLRQPYLVVDVLGHCDALVSAYV